MKSRQFRLPRYVPRFFHFSFMNPSTSFLSGKYSGILEFHYYKSPATELLAKYLDFAASIIHCYCGVFATEKTLKAINKVAATKQQTSDKYFIIDNLVGNM